MPWEPKIEESTNCFIYLQPEEGNAAHTRNIAVFCHKQLG
jgi:hypothetical protein